MNEPQPTILTLNDKSYHVIKLLGKGKGGYSYYIVGIAFLALGDVPRSGEVVAVVVNSVQLAEIDVALRSRFVFLFLLVNSTLGHGGGGFGFRGAAVV